MGIFEISVKDGKPGRGESWAGETGIVGPARICEAKGAIMLTYGMKPCGRLLRWRGVSSNRRRKTRNKN